MKLFILLYGAVSTLTVISSYSGRSHALSEYTYKTNVEKKEKKIAFDEFEKRLKALNEKKIDCSGSDQHGFLSDMIRQTKGKAKSKESMEKKGSTEADNLFTRNDMERIVPLVVKKSYLENTEEFIFHNKEFCENPILLNTLFFKCNAPITIPMIIHMCTTINQTGCIVDGKYYTGSRSSIRNKDTLLLDSQHKQRYFEIALIPQITDDFVNATRKKLHKSLLFLLCCHRYMQKGNKGNLGMLPKGVLQFCYLIHFLKDKIKEGEKEERVSIGSALTLLKIKEGMLKQYYRIDGKPVIDQLEDRLDELVKKIVGVQQF